MVLQTGTAIERDKKSMIGSNRMADWQVDSKGVCRQTSLVHVILFCSSSS